MLPTPALATPALLTTSRWTTTWRCWLRSRPPRDGAQVYLQAFQQRCGRSLTAAKLRQAVSEGDGDPVLMGMIRASQLQDSAAIQQLSQRIACKPRSGQ